VSDERYGEPESEWSGRDAGRRPAADGGGNYGDSAGGGDECEYRPEPVGAGGDELAEVAVSPVVMRKLRPDWREGGKSKWELLVSANGIAQQVDALDLASAESLFAMTLAVTVAGQDYLIESVAANEAVGQVYLYRLLVREAGGEAV
jgi:hypothetical protein